MRNKTFFVVVFRGVWNIAPPKI